MVTSFNWTWFWKAHICLYESPQACEGKTKQKKTIRNKNYYLKQDCVEAMICRRELKFGKKNRFESSNEQNGFHQISELQNNRDWEACLTWGKEEPAQEHSGSPIGPIILFAKQ